MSFILNCYKFIRAFSRKIRDDYISAFSSQAAFFIIISFFPFIMFLLNLVHYLPFSKSTILETMTNVFPMAFSSLMVSMISEIYEKASGTIISISVLTALWSAARGILAVAKGLNSVYGIGESRSYLQLRFMSAVYTFVFALILLVSLAVLVFGNSLSVWVTTKFPILNRMAFMIISMRTVIGLIVLTLFFLMIFLIIPNRKSTIMKELPGSLLSAGGWMIFSYAYSFYIDNMGNYSYMYGSLTAIVLFMLWLYFCMYIMFIGAEVNVILNEIDLKVVIRRFFHKQDESAS